MKREDESKGEDKRPAIDIPHDVVNEQIILASVLVDEEIRTSLISKIPAALFVDDSHRATWQAIKELSDQNVEFAVSSVYQRCSKEVDIAYLEALIKQYPEPPVNVSHHEAILKWDAIRAAAVRGPVADLIMALRDPLAPRERVRAIAKKIGQSLDQNVDRQFMLDPVILAREQAAKMMNRSVWPYGIDGFDKFEDGTYRIIPGAEPGKVTLITGVSGSSKSTVAAMISLAQARMHHRVLYGAWEMDPGPTLELLALMSLGWSRYAVSTGQLTAEQLETFRKRMEIIGSRIRFFEAPFTGRFTTKYTNDDALNELHGKISDSSADIVILDLWERMIPDGSPEAERRALFRTQEIFKETRSHGVLVCQQKLKDLENRRDKRPTRSTILGSQAWVDIADTIIGLHRPGHWEPAKGDTVIQLLLLKQRFGKWPLVAEGDWDGDKCTIRNCRSVDYEAIGRLGNDTEEWLGMTNKNKFKG